MFPVLLLAQEASVHDHVMIIHEHRALREREHISHVVDGVILRFSFRIGFQRFFESLADARVDLFVLVIGTCCRQPQASVEPHRFGAAERLRSVSLFALDGAASACAREQAWQNSWSSSCKNIAPYARRSESAASQGRLQVFCRHVVAAEASGAAGSTKKKKNCHTKKS